MIDNNTSQNRTHRRSLSIPESLGKTRIMVETPYRINENSNENRLRESTSYSPRDSPIRYQNTSQPNLTNMSQNRLDEASNAATVSSYGGADLVTSTPHPNRKAPTLFDTPSTLHRPDTPEQCTIQYESIDSNSPFANMEMSQASQSRQMMDANYQMRPLDSTSGYTKISADSGISNTTKYGLRNRSNVNYSDTRQYGTRRTDSK